uniref:c-type cytochrome n=1 Tax=Psychromonas algarum TaxID=2555643 RepID=UPI00326383E6
MSLIKRLSLFIALSMSLFSTLSFAQDLSEEAIAHRISPVGDVYLDGEVATASSGGDSGESAGPRSGEKIYNSFCVACHGTGAVGAPIKGDAAAWAPHIAKGEETLIKHAITGFNAMPPRGTCNDCTDEEITETVKFLTKGLW